MPSPARLAVALLAFAALPAAAQSEAYQLTPPPGWTRAEKDGALVLTPPGADAEQARIIVLPPKPLDPDFEAQAARERAAVEAALGLRSALPEPPRRVTTDAGERLAHRARYPSDTGDRYAGFYSLAAKGTFSLVVFYANSLEAYTRYAPPASTLFMGLRIAPKEDKAAAHPAAEPEVTEPAKPAEKPAP